MSGTLSPGLPAFTFPEEVEKRFCPSTNLYAPGTIVQLIEHSN